MKATDIRTRALNLADLANSQFVLYSDIANSLFESYRDIYTRYTDANSDFFLTETVINVTQAMIDPNSTSGLNEYLIPLPSDFLRLRDVEWKGQIVWQPMEKFSMMNKNTWGSYPRYRLQGPNLWVVGSTTMQFSMVRVFYYRSQPIATIPDMDKVFGFTQASISAKAAMKWGTYADTPNGLIYADGNNIQIDSLNTNTTAILYTGVSPTNVVYWAGYIYWLEGGNIKRASTVFTGTLAAVSLTGSGLVARFSVSHFDALLYYTDGTNTYKANLDGTGSVTLLTSVASSVYAFNGLFTLYIDSSNNLKTTSGLTLLAGSALSATTDGQKFIFVLDVSGNVWSYELSSTQPYTLSAGAILRQFVTYLGPYHAMRLPITDSSLNVLAISSAVDYDFSFPNNEANEMMAYQMAVDFRRKQSGNPVLLELLSARLADIQGRFSRVIHRDDFAPERVGNVYQKSWW